MMLETPNKILNLLADDDAALLAPHLERVELQREDVLFMPFEPIEYVHFFEGGMSSEIALSQNGNQIEVGCIGLEGFSAVSVILGVESTCHRSFMQAGGTALRARSIDLRRAMAASSSLTALLLRYAHVFMIQIAATALADGRYNVEQRLARWLLMSQDRVGDALPLTHDFLGLMLGVRRPSVTDALHILEGQRLITAERGLITIRNRQGLKQAAGDCYGASEQEYRRLLDDTWPSTALGMI